MALQQAKTELERSTNDFEGHRDSAVAACDKAMTELQAVVKIAGPGMPMPRPQPPMPTPMQAPPPPPAAPAAPPPGQP